MITTIQPCPHSNLYFALENGFRFEFPASIANELKKYLDNLKRQSDSSIIGEWILQLPFQKRMMVNMQLTNEKLVKRGVEMLMEKTGIEDEAAAKHLLLKYGSVKKAMDHHK
jgi:hypothetical protein